MPTVPELKEELTRLGVEWKHGMRKDELSWMLAYAKSQITSDSDSSKVLPRCH